MPSGGRDDGASLEGDDARRQIGARAQVLQENLARRQDAVAKAENRVLIKMDAIACTVSPACSGRD